MTSTEDYTAAKKRILRNRRVPVAHAQRLKLYGLIQQAEIGDCVTPPPSQDNIIAYQKWNEYNSHKGMSQEEAQQRYIDLVNEILKADKSKSQAKPPMPKLPPLNFRKTLANRGKKVKKRQESKTQVKAASSSSTMERQEDVPELPVVKKPEPAAKQDKAFRAELFRSRAFSSVEGILNPLNEHEDLAKKYELYEKVRAFYAVHDPARVRRGIGNVVEWALTHGEDALNRNLKKRYGTNLEDMEKAATKKVEEKRKADRKRRRSQLVLSKKYMQTKDIGLRKKMDKLTRFLLVNDPELVSRGMFLMVKFIEAKGLGALNENLKQNYGKTLDSVTDEELNVELKKRYGNDLGMLEKPFFAADDDSALDSVRTGTVSTTDTKTSGVSLAEQVRTMDPKTVRETQVEALKQVRSMEQSTRKTRAQKAEAEKVKQATKPRGREAKDEVVVKPTATSFDSAAYRETLTPQDKYKLEYEQKKPLLKAFVERYEPYRFNEAFQLMSEYMKRHGEKDLNKKLRKKYDVDLDSFQNIKVDMDITLSDEEFELKVLQFVNKHEHPKNIDRAVRAMKGYRQRQGLAALNTKLYIKYGETLNDLVLDESAAGGSTEKELTMQELHRVELPHELKEKLRSYYAKYDPLMLNNEGVKKIFEWVERHGLKALDIKLKEKYKESLTDFVEGRDKLKEELEMFYSAVDPSKVETKQVDSVLKWAILNGRDALNFNLRRKYDKDLDSIKKHLSRTTGSVTTGLDI